MLVSTFKAILLGFLSTNFVNGVAVTRRRVSERELKDFANGKPVNWTDAGDSTIEKRWDGIKGSFYSPNCGGDGNYEGYTWTDIGYGCYASWGSDGKQKDMWSIGWDNAFGLAMRLGCTSPTYELWISMYHGCTNCNCGTIPSSSWIGDDGRGCVKIQQGQQQQSIKSFRFDCIPA